MLDELRCHSWHLQLQKPEAEARFVSAGVDVLRLKPGQEMGQPNRIANRLSKVDVQNLSAIEVSQVSALTGSAKPAALNP